MNNTPRKAICGTESLYGTEITPSLILGCERRFDVVNWPTNGRETAMHLWTVLGPLGGINLRANPIADGKLANIMRGSDITPVINGRMWFCWDWGRHASIRISEHDPEKPTQRDCWVTDGDCWYDGSSLKCNDVIRAWGDAGCNDEVIWTELEAYYGYWLEDYKP